MEVYTRCTALLKAVKKARLVVTKLRTFYEQTNGSINSTLIAEGQAHFPLRSENNLIT